MKQLKRIACLSLVSVLFAASSLAEGAPASQFGVNNWPYRNPNSACGTTNQPQDCATATPAPVPSAQPTAGVQAYGQAAAHGSANRQAHGRAHKLREPWGLYYGFRLCARVFCMEFTKC